MTLTPAYGRDYRSRKALLADFNADLDFVTQPDGRYANRQDLAGLPDVNVRYGKLRKVAVLTNSNGVWK